MGLFGGFIVIVVVYVFKFFFFLEINYYMIKKKLIRVSMVFRISSLLRKFELNECKRIFIINIFLISIYFGFFFLIFLGEFVV